MLIETTDCATLLGVSADDALLVRLVASTDRWIKKQCSREFERAVRTEVVRGYGKDYIFTRESPIIAITAVRIDRFGLFPIDTIITDLSPFIFDPTRDDNRVYYSNGYFPAGAAVAQLEYEAGFDADIPEDLREKLIERVAAKYKQGADEEMKSEAQGDRSYVKFDETDKRILAALRGYKR